MSGGKDCQYAKFLAGVLNDIQMYLGGKTKPDFIVTVTYLTSEQGGRKTPANSGYRPQFKIASYEMQTSGQQIFIGKDFALPGETIDAEVTILSPHLFLRMLYVGQYFEFREGAKIVATGKINRIINKDLEVLKK